MPFTLTNHGEYLSEESKKRRAEETMKTYTKAEKFATPQQRELLKKHYGLIELVNSNQYLPPGYDATVQELNKIHKEIYGQEVDLACGHCVHTMFVDLYIPREVLYENVTNDTLRVS